MPLSTKLNRRLTDSSEYLSSWRIRLNEQCRKRLPILKWLPRYKKGDFVADMIAGVTVGLTCVPQSMAYAAIAGLSPEYGLYSSYIGCFLYVILGSCRQVTIGPTAVMGLLTYETCKSSNPTCAIMVGFYSGVFELLMAFLQLGWVVSFISEPVTIGFTAGAATTIISSQIKNMFGIDGPKGSGFVGYWKAIFRDLHTIRVSDAILGCVSFATLLFLRKVTSFRTSDSHKGRILKTVLWLVSVSRNVIIVTITTIIAFSWTNIPFKLTGYVQSGFPPVGVPQFVLPRVNDSDIVQNSETSEFMTYWETWSAIGAGPLIIALISVLQNVAISKAFGTDQTIDATQEMLALGVVNVVGGFFSSMPVSGSFSRSAVNQASGVRTPFGGVFTGALILMSLGFLTRSFHWIPKASLAAVIIAAVMFIIEFKAVLPMWRVRKIDVVICLITYLCSIFLGMEYGILVGVASSLSILLIGSLKPKIISEVKTDDLTGLPYLLVTPDPGLTFISVDHIHVQMDTLSTHYNYINVIVLNFKYWNACDYTIAKTLFNLHVGMSKRGKTLIFMDCNIQWQNIFTSATTILNLPFCTKESLSEYLTDRFPVSKKNKQDIDTHVKNNEDDICIHYETTKNIGQVSLLKPCSNSNT